MRPTTLVIQTSGEGLYNVTENVQEAIQSQNITSGIATIFCLHTSCALTINEAYDPSAKEDLERFLQHIAPRNLAFIQHTAEGPDDSPSHMKAMLLQPSLQCLVEDRRVILGRWQGIFLAEFRDQAHERKLLVKVQEDKV